MASARHRQQADKFDEKDEFDGEEREEEIFRGRHGDNHSKSDVSGDLTCAACHDTLGCESAKSSSVYTDKRNERGRERPEGLKGGNDAIDVTPELSKEDEQRLLGAFLLAADKGFGRGVNGLGERDGNEKEEEAEEADAEAQLPMDGPTCLHKFATIAASLGLKSTRDQIRADFEKVVRGNGLAVTSNPRRPWKGAYDANIPVRGFTYKVFKRYYLAKIQGELLESDIRQAWDDLHYGTGQKTMLGGGGGAHGDQAGVSCIGLSATSGGRAYVARAELQKILTREGEALTDEEVDELLRECRPDEEGRIVYEGYRRMLIDPSL